MKNSIGIDTLTYQIIGAAIEVHRIIGPGLLESVYESCLAYELMELGLKIERQKSMPLSYKNIEFDCVYRADLIIENEVIVEIKAISEIHDIHKSQLLSYLKISDLKVGLIINFNVPVLRDGVHRAVNRL